VRYSGPCAPGEAEIRLTVRGAAFHHVVMSERDKRADEKPQADARAEKEARLAKALRDNLRRRKAPGRGEAEPNDPQKDR
jgi:hypothetical protein